MVETKQEMATACKNQKVSQVAHFQWLRSTSSRLLQLPANLKWASFSADGQCVMIDDIDQLVADAVSAVFATMLNLPLVQEPAGTVITNGEPHVAGSVGFIGTITGVVFVYSTARFARTATGRMLGMREGEISSEEMVNDAVGEITNMVVGQIKSHLADRGMKCVLTIPSIVRGSHFTIEPTSSSERRVSTFKCNDNQVVVEVLLKQGQENSFAV